MSLGGSIDICSASASSTGAAASHRTSACAAWTRVTMASCPT